MLFLPILYFMSLTIYPQTDRYQAAIYENGADILRYRTMYPKCFSRSEQYPIVLFLHGEGVRGDTNHNSWDHAFKEPDC